VPGYQPGGSSLVAGPSRGYREGKISHSQLRRLLGLQTRTDVDAFLKDRGVEFEYTAEDLERDRETLKRFGVSMHEIVADTTPLNYLVLIEAVGILPRLFASVLIPPAFKKELSHGNAPAAVSTWIANPPSWLKVVNLSVCPGGISGVFRETPADWGLPCETGGPSRLFPFVSPRHKSIVLLTEEDSTH